MMAGLPEIAHGQVRLRPLAERDLPQTLQWRNRDAVRRWMKTKDLLRLDTHRAWFAAYTVHGVEQMFIIEDRDTGVALGQVGIYAIDRSASEAEIGRFIAAPDAVGRGLLKQGMKAMCDWALGPFGLARLYCDIYAANLPSIRACEWAGFSVTGTDGEFVRMERCALPATMTWPGARDG